MRRAREGEERGRRAAARAPTVMSLPSSVLTRPAPPGCCAAKRSTSRTKPSSTSSLAPPASAAAGQARARGAGRGGGVRRLTCNLGRELVLGDHGERGGVGSPEHLRLVGVQHLRTGGAKLVSFPPSSSPAPPAPSQQQLKMVPPLHPSAAPSGASGARP